MNQRHRAHLALAGTTLIFGMHYSIAKSMMPVPLSPLQLIFMRSLGGVVLFLAYQRLFIRERVEKRDLVLLALCGVLGFSLNQTLFYVGLNMTSPVDASLIHLLNPILVLMFAHFIIRERITWFKSAGILAGALGALVLIVYGRRIDFSGSNALGNFLVFLNMVFYALYLVLIKPLTTKYHRSTILAWVSLFGFLAIVPLTVKPALGISFMHFTVAGYLGLAYIIVMNTFVAYLLINFALSQLMPATVSYYNYLQPFIAAVLTVSAGQDIITWPKVAAALLIFSGVYLVNRTPN